MSRKIELQRMRWVAVLLGGVLVAVLLLAAGLGQVRFRPGSLFAENTLRELMVLLAQLRPYAGALLVCLAGLVIFLILNRSASRTPTASRAEARRSLLGTLVQGFLWILAIILLRRKLIESQIEWTLPQVDLSAVELSEGESVQGFPLQVPEWAAFMLSLGLILLLGLLIWRAYRRRRSARGSLELLAQEAALALQGIEAGFDLRNVILRCYHEMVRVVEGTVDVRREEGMTAREFEARLVAIGLPEEPVIQLTRLFEAVRYGAKDLDESAEQQAKECLSAVLAASEGAI